MKETSTVPTAITFIIFIGLALGVFFIIKNVVGVDQEKLHDQAAMEIGALPNIRISIDGEQYTAITLVSYASQDFIKNTPISLEMRDDGINKKRGCSYYRFNGDAVRAKKVEKGDLLIYGDSCIVIATGDFTGDNQYKKIGHINNMGAVSSGTMMVNFSLAR